ncbi:MULTISPECIES: polysaccharide pyruvyl transferase family protein [Providencia]|uniref:polysaccharide pyruvyl transferase family protein n=1 Tax=Providencia TaxID=586 RepID=UPI0014199726|nr:MULTISPECIES: polysaccharide pyruvyl transferase family protein [Providencia]ELR5146634.1 polysaccharide pyruvyl transferase family protein [Providencia rettgeri]NIA44657.1 polysaccharide pyruvyl transferase family protein [Providencia rettgeri]NIA96915.1 polysaccharide pyruvyl transferase family protein [Providencia rettgeri]NIB14739.1 polysaccharide pyruvyl transferase family protein [Providencia rettgeri]NIB34951.1 polysaccharide pyruvyl transferase family protein [Providencia rettgeri]
MAKKIGILNFQFSNHNYGAVLQAAALENTIKKLGHNVEHINYLPYNSNNFKNKIKYGFWGHLIKAVLRKSKFSDYRMNKVIFEKFRQSWITRSNKYYYNSEEIKQDSHTYGAIVVGSDQVWRPKMYPNFKSDVQVYFLDGISNNTRRISYAASFGVDEWEIKDHPALTDSIMSNLKKFHAISVREDSGTKICCNVFNVKSQHVLDPTLLSDKNFFDKIISTSVFKKETSPSDIVYYKLDIDENFKRKLKKISKNLNFSTENIYYNESKLWFNSYIPVPLWLSKIKNSKLVITDSFHCVCFSIIFNKDFYCIRNKERGESRLESLLLSLGLDNRLVSLDSLENVNFNSNIDYSVINKKVEKLKINSFEFLKESLQ